jgi:hypothetical protein
MKNIIKISLVLVVLISCAEQEVKSQPIEIKDTLIESKNYDSIIPFLKINGIPSNFDTVPGYCVGKCVFRSKQPKLDELKTLIENYPIDVVVRMNDTEGTGVTIEQERKLVESMGKKFVWVNAHLGYESGKGYLKSLEKVQPILDSGNVLIHCTAGKDRTGYQVGKYIQNNFGWSKQEIWNYTIKYNEWEYYIPQQKRGYIKYMEAFYPYEEWKKKN